jgi:cation diffusion facilitator family transporter
MLRLGRRVAMGSIAASVALASTNVVIGLSARSTSVVAAGLEFAGDVLASTFVFVGMSLASKPADSDHPYGHGRFETLAGLMVGIVLLAGGAGISYRSLEKVSEVHAPPQAYAVWGLVAAILVRGSMSLVKFRVGRAIRSAALVADAWNDTIDILSATAALVALGLTLHNPEAFLAADHYGGFTVGVFVIFTGLRVIRDASLELADTMPARQSLDVIREAAVAVPGVLGVEKCFARKTGLQYHVDLHLEVDPNLTVRESHNIATQVRIRLREGLPWVADVLVHVEPAPGLATHQPGWNYEQQPREDPGDETSVNLRAYLDRMPDDKMLQYRPEWADEQVREWCGDFRDDGFLFLICSERDVDVSEFRRELESCIAYRDRVRPHWR